MDGIGALSSLKSFYCYRCTSLVDLSALRNHPSLTARSLSGSAITSVESLAELTRLSVLRIANTKIEVLTPLATLPFLTELDKQVERDQADRFLRTETTARGIGGAICLALGMVLLPLSGLAFAILLVREVVVRDGAGLVWLLPSGLVVAIAFSMVRFARKVSNE